MMLAIDGLNQFYGGSHILWDVAMSVPQGSCTVLMGRNGMGKTTLLRCIMGLTPLATGSIHWDGVDLTARPASDRARLRIGYVPQGREIFSQLTVEENLRTGLSARHDGLRRIPPHVYEIFPVLREMANRRGGDLSGGQQQQLAIGRALVTDPTLLVLDEPTEGIQPNIVHEIGDVIMRLNREQGLTVLLVEQKLPIARRVGTELRIMENGRLVVTGAIGALTDDVVKQHLTV
jgi:urea transport system ATP-binding protein